MDWHSTKASRTIAIESTYVPYRREGQVEVEAAITIRHLSKSHFLNCRSFKQITQNHFTIVPYTKIGVNQLVDAEADRPERSVTK